MSLVILKKTSKAGHLSKNVCCLEETSELLIRSNFQCKGIRELLSKISHLPLHFTASRVTSSSEEGLFQHSSRFNWNRFCLWQGKAERINSSVAERRCAEPQISNSGPCLESNWKQAVISYREHGVDETTRHAHVSRSPLISKTNSDASANALAVTFHLCRWTSSQVFLKVQLAFLCFPPGLISHLFFFPHRQLWACIAVFLSHVEDVQ